MKKIILSSYIFDHEEVVKSMSEELLLSEDSEDVTLYINSGGGSVFCGFHLANAILQKKKQGSKIIGVITGQASSMGSYIALMCDELIVFQNSFMMFHAVSGGDKEIRERLTKIIESHILSKVSKEKIKDVLGKELEEILKGEDDVWIDAEQMLKLGFVKDIMPVNVATELESVANKTRGKEDCNGLTLKQNKMDNNNNELMNKAIKDERARVESLLMYTEIDKDIKDAIINGGEVTPVMREKAFMRSQLNKMEAENAPGIAVDSSAGEDKNPSSYKESEEIRAIIKQQGVTINI